MPFLQEVAPEIILVIFFINGMVGYGNYVFDVPLKTPFDFNANVTAVSTPVAFQVNNTNNVIGNFTNPSNSTSTNSIIKAIQADVFALAQFGYILIAIISGGFIWNDISIFLFPQQFIYIIEGGIVFLIGRTIYYYWTGK